MHMFLRREKGLFRRTLHRPTPRFRSEPGKKLAFANTYRGNRQCFRSRILATALPIRGQVYDSVTMAKLWKLSVHLHH